jgi:hypothetical protein
MTTIWFRDPYNYVAIAAKEGIDRYVLSKSHLMARKIDPLAFMRKHFLTSSIRPEFMTIGHEGAALYDLFSRLDRPKAFYPVWSFDEGVDTLVDILANPVGQDEGICSTTSVDPSIRPVLGQDHVVVLMDVPNQKMGINRQRLAEIAALTKEFPDAKIHVTGSYTFRVMFDQGFTSADYDPWSVTRTYLSMPSGYLVQGNRPDKQEMYEGWITMLGFTVQELEAMKTRLHFNIRSVKWAGRYYNTELNAKRRFHPTRDQQDLSTDMFTEQASGVKDSGPGRKLFNNRRTIAKKHLALLNNGPVTDGILCDWCVFRISCKLSREGSVCTAGASKVGDLADYFGTRDASRIIDGLSKLMQRQADRLEDSIAVEEDAGEPNPEVTRQMNSLFANGVKLAKLIDPNLNGKGANVNILNVNGVGAAASIASGDPRQMVAAAVKALEDSGIKREEITPEMLKGLLSNMAHGTPQQAIEAKVIEHEGK